MSIMKRLLLMFATSTAFICVLVGLTFLAAIAIKAAIMHLPVWACFIALPCIGGAFITVLAFAVCMLELTQDN